MEDHDGTKVKPTQTIEQPPSEAEKVAETDGFQDRGSSRSAS